MTSEVNIISPCENCTHSNICKYTDSMEEVVNSIKETTGSQEFIEDITIGCKHQSSQPPFTRPEGAREAGLDSLQYARELGSTPNYTNPYKLDKPSDLVDSGHSCAAWGFVSCL